MKKILIVILTIFAVIPAELGYAKNKLSNLSSKYICVIDYGSGRVLFEKSSNKIVPMASTTKIMTAIVALENSNMSDIVTVSKRASSIRGSTVGLKYGQKLTMEELLYGLMLRSGNDCAIAIAEHVGGSVEKFTGMMDSKAFDIGAFDTHFSTPHGLDAIGHFTTAYDLALITRYAMSNSIFSSIVSTKDVTINGIEGQRSFHNINKILWMVDGADGVKTGYTGKAGKCLVSSASNNEKRVICVILDSNNRWNDSKMLLEYGLNNFKDNISIDLEDYYAHINVNNGNKSKVKVGFDIKPVIPLSDEERENITIQKVLPKNLNAPLYMGQQIGYLAVYSNGKEIYKVPYKIQEDIEISKAKNLLQRILYR